MNKRRYRIKWINQNNIIKMNVNLINHNKSLNFDAETLQSKIVEKYKQKGLIQKKK